MASTLTNGKGNNLQSMFASVNNRASITKIDWQDIEPRDQSRKTFTAIDELAESIKASGQLQPIIVASIEGSDGKYTVIAGERRWRACRQLDIQVDAIIRARGGESIREVAVELVENIQRENLTPTEIGNALKRLLDDGYSQGEIAQELGKSKQFVSAHLSLAQLPPCIQKLSDEQVTRDGDTLNYLRKLHDVDPKLAEAECNKALKHGISRQLASKLLKKAKEPKKQGATPTPTPHTQDPQSGAGDVPGAARNPEVIHHSKQGWSQVARGNLKVTVSFPIDSSKSDHRTGFLMTDRVDDDRDYLWVLCARGRDSGYEPIRVLAEDLTILAAEAGFDE